MEHSLNTFDKGLVDKILAVDPSGTGTTGIYFKNGVQEEFKEIKEKDWIKHYDFIASLVKVYQPNILLFESSNFIRLRGKDMTSLFKLLGALEVLEVERSVGSFYKGPQKVRSVPVDQVKKLTKQLLAGTYQIKDLEYKQGRGKGWMYKGKRVSIHCLEAYIVYLIGK